MDPSAASVDLPLHPRPSIRYILSIVTFTGAYRESAQAVLTWLDLIGCLGDTWWAVESRS
ncbi:hypothetical protein U9M48_008221 [Paspalum notatum var. saurae]|uniref:Uncharacterized protein n=1 Tax=Paspalum notatum var. saurae TaxID=547442 RepID=A0AAQ3SNL9_PASNO